jgi:hypothetical protein
MLALVDDTRVASVGVGVTEQAAQEEPEAGALQCDGGSDTDSDDRSRGTGPDEEQRSPVTVDAEQRSDIAAEEESPLDVWVGDEVYESAAYLELSAQYDEVQRENEKMQEVICQKDAELKQRVRDCQNYEMELDTVRAENVEIKKQLKRKFPSSSSAEGESD